MEDGKSRAEKKEGTRIERKSKPYEKITNGEKQIVEKERAKMEKNGGKRKERAPSVDEKRNPQSQTRETGGRNGAGLVHESE